MTEICIDIQLSAQKLIAKHLKDNGWSISWLARKVDLDVRHLSGILRGVQYLTEKNRQKINTFLKTNY